MLTPNNDSAPGCDRSAMLIRERERREEKRARKPLRRDERDPNRVMHLLQ